MAAGRSVCASSETEPSGPVSVMRWSRPAHEVCAGDSEGKGPTSLAVGTPGHVEAQREERGAIGSDARDAVRAGGRRQGGGRIQHERGFEEGSAVRFDPAPDEERRARRSQSRPALSAPHFEVVAQHVRMEVLADPDVGAAVRHEVGSGRRNERAVLEVVPPRADRSVTVGEGAIDVGQIGTAGSVVQAQVVSEFMNHGPGVGYRKGRPARLTDGYAGEVRLALREGRHI